jgi:LmbE family N-acetylglucosaminyl deacetylase
MSIRACLAFMLSTGFAFAAPEKTVIVIGAHADDVVQIAGATFAKYIADGYRGVYAVLATHRSGSKATPGKLEPEPLESIQLESEAALAAARHYGAELVAFRLHPTRIRHGRSLVFTGSPSWSRFLPPGKADISAAPVNRAVVSEVAALLIERNPKLVITHAIGQGDVEHHSAADLVYRAWNEARGKGARLGQLWFQADDSSGMISEASYRRFFEPTQIAIDVSGYAAKMLRVDFAPPRTAERFFVVADASEPQPEPLDRLMGQHWQTALAPSYSYRSSRKQPVIMAIGSHCDDVEAQLGGAFVHFLQQGWKGVYVIATNNTAGNALSPGGKFPIGGLETIQVRQEEGRRAAAVHGLEPHFLDLHEMILYIGRKRVSIDDKEWGPYDAPGSGPVTSAPEGKGLELTTALLEKYEPDIVLTHLLADKPEHGQVGDLVYRAFKQAGARGAQLGQLWMPVGRFLQYFQRVRLKPDISIDVTEEYETNWKAALHHVSQGTATWGSIKPVAGRKNYEHFIVILDNAKRP